MIVDLRQKRILVYGAGVTGRSVVPVLVDAQANVVLASRGEVDVWGGPFKKYPIELVNEDNMDQLEGIELIILSPGIDQRSDFLKKMNALNIPIWSEIELASFFNKAPIIAVTGSNGKTTTVHILKDLIEFCGKKVFLAGNVGRPFIEIYWEKEKYDYIVLELSSFQLETIYHFHPKVAGIINLQWTHGERYLSFEEYTKAKLNIFKNLSTDDLALLPEDIKIPTNSFKLLPTSYDKMRSFLSRYRLEHFKLIGKHNRFNLYFALSILEHLKFPFEKLQEGISLLRSLPHRVEPITVNDSFLVFNDSKSTNLDATLSAVDVFVDSEKPLCLIMGGKLRAKDFNFSKAINFLDKKLVNLYLFGEAAEYLHEGFNEKLPCEVLKLEEIVQRLREQNFKGILLFSPGFPSFDLFKDYNHRGNYFKSLFL